MTAKKNQSSGHPTLTEYALTALMYFLFFVGVGVLGQVLTWLRLLD